MLAGWREKDDVLNYRRFFDVDGLVAVRVEEPDVFDATHRVLVDLNHRGIVEGFRIDHPDGLADPAGYVDRLRAALRPGSAIWVEKILEGDETLPPWACDGTTGYDAAKVVSAALLDPATAPALQDAWTDTGGDPSLEHVVEESKREVVDRVLVPEHRRLVRRAREALPDADPDRLTEAVAELLVACEVYRAYVGPDGSVDDQARERLTRAGDRAAAVRPDLKPELESLVGLAVAPGDAAARDFAVRLQQTWGPVMAKGIEDTAFYRWHRQVGLNEVGGDPDLLDVASADDLHDWAAHQQQHWPLGMTTLSTHDTKRSEDVRARLAAVAGDAEAWQRCSDAFAAAARERGVDAPTAHLVWQTLAGVGPVEEERVAALPHQGDAGVQAAHLVARPGPRVRSPRPGAGRGRRWGRRARRPGAHRGRPQPRRRARVRARPEAPPAHRCPACRTPTRAASSSTCPWSTPTTGGRSTTTTGAPASRTCSTTRPATCPTRSCWSPTRR